MIEVDRGGGVFEPVRPRHQFRSAPKPAARHQEHRERHQYRDEERVGRAEGSSRRGLILGNGGGFA